MQIFSFRNYFRNLQLGLCSDFSNFKRKIVLPPSMGNFRFQISIRSFRFKSDSNLIQFNFCFQFNPIGPVQSIRSDSIRFNSVQNSIQSNFRFVVSDSIQSVRFIRSDSIRFNSVQNPIQHIRSDSNFLNQAKVSLVINAIPKSIFMSNCVWGVILNFWATLGYSEIQDLAFPNDFNFQLTIWSIFSLDNKEENILHNPMFKSLILF